MPRRLRPLAEPLLATAALLAFWQVGPGLLDLPAYVLPPLDEVVAALVEARAVLLSSLATTTREVLAGFALAVAGGVALAVAIYGSVLLRRTAYPLLIGFQGLPKVALAPLLVVWFGYGTGSKVLMSFLFAVFPVVIATLGGLAGTPAHLEEHFRALRASRWDTFRRLRVPHALPSVVDGCKVAMPLTIIGAVVGEFVGSQQGIGALIQVAAGGNRTDLVFAALIVITALSFALFAAIDLAGRLVWWRGQTLT